MSIWMRCMGLPEVNDHSGGFCPWLTLGTCQTSIAVTMHLFGRARPPESSFLSSLDSPFLQGGRQQRHHELRQELAPLTISVQPSSV